MSRRGDNLADFRATQLSFAAHIRQPELYPRPPDVEARRMKIYLDLFYNNIESFLAGAFPVARKILLAQDLWHRTVREFVHLHASSSPYFLEISQEFLTFLGNRSEQDLPDFLLELCHYEWVELALSVSELELPVAGIEPDGSLLESVIVVSPLIWKLAYRYPVHLLGPAWQPEQAPTLPTHLIVNRRRDDSVGFLETNALTLRLLDILETRVRGLDALKMLGDELPELTEELLLARGIETLQLLRDAQILLGTETES
jgi:hypothetical protein